jgi:hypothetical protein
MLHRPPLAVLSLLSLAVIACGASEGDGSALDPLSPGGAGGGGGNDAGKAPGNPSNPCGLDTPFAGDENCILPPDPEEGFQLRVGPSDYDDPDVLYAKDDQGRYLWIMEPGDESTQCYHIISPNEEGRYYFKQQYRMRFGSHHMIIQASDNTSGVEGWGRCVGSIVGAIGGTQQIVEDIPPGGVVPPEDEGLGRAMEAHTPLDIQLHFYNPTSEPTLREVWVNFWYKPAEEVQTNLGMLGGFTRLNIPPGTQTTVGNECLFEQAIGAQDPVRVVTLFGHAHYHNTRFAVWHDKVDETSELVYDSYEGAEAPTYYYNTVVQNPVPDPEAHRTGGKSGMLLLRPGEKLRFECDINNTTDVTFCGRNEVFDDEMCNLFGSVAGFGFPCFDLERLSSPTPRPPCP